MAALRDTLTAINGAQPVTISKRAARLAAQYDGGSTRNGQSRREGLQPTHETRGTAFERLGAVLALYQQNRPVSL
jgi:hypothetical protein